MTEFKAPQPAHTPGPWTYEPQPHCDYLYEVMAAGYYVATTHDGVMGESNAEANARLIAAAPELLAACINARDMLSTDRQAFVDCQQLRDSRTDDPIAHGLVAVEDGVWLDADDAEALRDYDRAIELIDKATAKATGAQA